MTGLTAARAGHALARPCHAPPWIPARSGPNVPETRRFHEEDVPPLAAAVLSLALTAGAAPIYMKLGDAFKTRVTLSEAAKTPGGGMLAPGAYDVEIAALGGQEVRATFFDKTGRKAGEANGKSWSKAADTGARRRRRRRRREGDVPGHPLLLGDAEELREARASRLTS